MAWRIVLCEFFGTCFAFGQRSQRCTEREIERGKETEREREREEGRGKSGSASARTRNEVDRRVCCPRCWTMGTLPQALA